MLMHNRYTDVKARSSAGIDCLLYQMKNDLSFICGMLVHLSPTKW